MKRVKSTGVFAASAAAVLMLSASAAQAAPTYGDIVAPGVYFGSGNVNGNWTIDTTNGVEVALRIKDRATLATVDGSSGVYQVNTGLCNPVCGGASKAAWNYEFSVNTHGGGGALDLSAFTILLDVDQDAGAGATFTTINLFSNWPDNAYWNGTSVRTGTAPVAGEFGVQQSANPLFGDSGFGYLPGPGLYDLRLRVLDSTGALVAQTAVAVAVPEPASLALVGVALAAAGASRRRRV